MKKIREYFNGKNPYLLASIAVVILSIGVIGALLWDAPSAEDAGVSVSTESSMEGSVETQESEVQTEEVRETEEITEVLAETQQAEEPQEATVSTEDSTGLITEEYIEEDPEVIPEPEEIPEPEVHEHSWIFESYYQKPTCSNGGLVTQICAHCGETQITGGAPTGEHFYEVETSGDCCSAEVVVCTECNYREVREKDPTNHIDIEDGFCYGCGWSSH